MVISERLRLLLNHLNSAQYRRRPEGVGQKTVNIADKLGFIESIKSRPTKLLPDLHRLSSEGEALKRRRFAQARV